MSEEEEEGPECGYFEGYTTQRFVIITVFSGIAVFGMLANVLLLLVFRRSLPSSIYLAFLSLLDALLCAVYLLLFGVDAGFVYTGNETLFLLYHMYIVPIFFVSRIVQFTIPYMLIWANFERFVWTCGEVTRATLAPLFSDLGRTLTVLFTAVIAIILRLPIVFAVKVEQFPECPDPLRSQSVAPTELTGDPLYQAFDTHGITFLQQVFPFFILLVLNFIIVRRILAEKRNLMQATVRENRLVNAKKSTVVTAPIDGSSGGLPENYVLLSLTAQIMKESLITKSSRNRREQLRSAIYTMLAIVTSYLVSNGLHLVLLFFERTGSSLLQHPTDKNMSSDFYIALGDTVSIVYMLSSATRLPIYMWCNKKLRYQIVDFVRGCTRTKSVA